MAVALKEDRPVRGAEAIAERPDGTRVPFIPYPTPLHDSHGKLVGAINMLVDISERKKAEENAMRLASIVASSDDAIISKDTNGIIQTWNKGAEQLFGYEAHEVIGKAVNILIPPDRQDEEPAILARIRRGEHIEHYETVRMCKDGTLIDISLMVSPLEDARGKVVGASKIARNITEKKREEERRKLLINELNHRVKNSLATVQSIAAQTFRNETQNPALRQFESRLMALARAHDVLTRESWEGADFEQLLGDTIEAVCVEPGRRFELAGPKLRLRPKLALSLALVFHELCTNAAKYGALSSDDGRITIIWEILDSKTGRHLSVLWKELGGPEVKLPTTKGFGSRLIKRALSHEFGARADLAFEPSGVVCRIDTPLA